MGGTSCKQGRLHGEGITAEPTKVRSLLLPPRDLSHLDSDGALTCSWEGEEGNANLTLKWMSRSLKNAGFSSSREIVGRGVDLASDTNSLSQADLGPLSVLSPRW